MMILSTMMASDHCLIMPMTPFIFPIYISPLFKLQQCPFAISSGLETSFMAEMAKRKKIGVNYFIKLLPQSWIPTCLWECIGWLGLRLINFMVFVSVLGKFFVTFAWDFATNLNWTMSSRWSCLRSELESLMVMARNGRKCGGKIVFFQYSQDNIFWRQDRMRWWNCTRWRRAPMEILSLLSSLVSPSGPYHPLGSSSPWMCMTPLYQEERTCRISYMLDGREGGTYILCCERNNVCRSGCRGWLGMNVPSRWTARKKRRDGRQRFGDGVVLRRCCKWGAGRAIHCLSLLPEPLWIVLWQWWWKSWWASSFRGRRTKYSRKLRSAGSANWPYLSRRSMMIAVFWKRQTKGCAEGIPCVVKFRDGGGFERNCAVHMSVVVGWHRCWRWQLIMNPQWQFWFWFAKARGNSDWFKKI